MIKLYQPPHPSLDRPKAAGPSFSLDEIVDGLKNDEFEPFYQPKVAMATGRIKGAEALARWRHPQKGIIDPYEFIGPMEANGLIDELTWIMLKKTAVFCSKWLAASKPQLSVTVSVNLSVKSLSDARLAEHVMAIVRDTGLDPKHMILEVTESATMSDIGMVLENLSRLRMKGFGLSIDDYGTGYSSMQQLTRIAFTELKIDQSFVANAGRQESARIIIESSLDMAKRLHIVSVAEGIETQMDWDMLRQLGCQVAQGYFVSRPMAAGVFLKWSRDRNNVDSLSARLTT